MTPEKVNLIRSATLDPVSWTATLTHSESHTYYTIDFNFSFMLICMVLSLKILICQLQIRLINTFSMIYFPLLYEF